jgi:hypothetical protein
VAMNMTSVPYHLASFKIDLIQEILKINEAEKRQYPPPFIPTNSQKKNKASKTFVVVTIIIVPFYIANDQKGDFSEDLIKQQAQMEPDMFYMYRYKTAYCP